MKSTWNYRKDVMLVESTAALTDNQYISDKQKYIANTIK